jgi:transposase-like protein
MNPDPLDHAESTAANWAREERRGSMCAECPSVRGLATCNKMSPGIQTISYRCPRCGRTWDHDYRQKPERIRAER